jgi:hypothetical protein
MLTKTAAVGIFESHGEDFIQFIDEHGAVKNWTDANGITHGEDFVANGVSLQALSIKVDNITISGLPPSIDPGTF